MKDVIKVELEDLNFILEVLKGNVQDVGKAISIINKCLDFNLLESLTAIKKIEACRGYPVHNNDEFEKIINNLGGLDKTIEDTVSRLKK